MKNLIPNCLKDQNKIIVEYMFHISIDMKISQKIINAETLIQGRQRNA